MLQEQKTKSSCDYLLVSNYSHASFRVVAELLSRFKNYIETGDDTRIVPELQEAIYFTAARNGGLAEWEALRKIALNPKTPTAKNHALVALAEFEVPELIEKTYKFMMTEVKTQDIM